MATHSRTLAWKIPWMEETGRLWSMGFKVLDTEIDSLGVGELKDVKGQSVQFSHSVVSNFLQHHGLQNARLPCQSAIHRAYSNSCPLSR